MVHSRIRRKVLAGTSNVTDYAQEAKRLVTPLLPANKLAL